MLAAAKQAITRTVLTTAMDGALNAFGNAFDTVLFSNIDEMISQTGKSRQEILNACMADDEVDACRTDIHAAIVAKPWRIYDDVSGDGSSGDDVGSGVPAATINRFYKAIRPLIDDFAELAILAKFNGYAVAEYVYKQEADGFWVIDKVLSKDGLLDKFSLKQDGSLHFTGINGIIAVDTKVKALTLTSRATPARPTGEMMILKAYPAVALRRRGLAYAGQFIARYAQPFVVGKQGNSFGALTDFTQKLFGFINGGATGIGTDDDINIHQLQGNGDAFEIIEKLCNQRIQKLLLGRVKVSEMTNGSRAASETDDKARTDRMRAYLDLMTTAVQHAINAMLLVNNHYGMPINAPQGLWFEYIEEADIDVRRAERDKIYSDTGQIRFTREYFIDMARFEAHHFVLVDEVGNTPRLLNDAPNNAPSNASTNIPTAIALSQSADDELPDNLPTPPTQVAHDLVAPMAALVNLVQQCNDYDAFARAFGALGQTNRDKRQLADLAENMANETATAFIAGLTDGQDGAQGDKPNDVNSADDTLSGKIAGNTGASNAN